MRTSAAPPDDAQAHLGDWDFVVVGSGAGGGTLAARLAEKGMRVFLIEAGEDPLLAGGERLPDDYSVPGFHAFACENPAMSWNFHVRHYADEARQARDPKYDAARGGVLYPRAAAVGGCTAHNAMIFMLPHESDWAHIAQLTGDASWSARCMRRYAKRLEACGYSPLWRALRHVGLDPTGHGWDGWLGTQRSLPVRALGDRAIVQLVAATTLAFARSLPNPLASTWHWLLGAGDPNARFPHPWSRGSFEGLCYTPLSTVARARNGTRERLRQVAAAPGNRLHIETNALATRVLFDDEGAACGVEYLKGRQLYRAHAKPAESPGETRRVHARREVVLCGGAFNTPQLLMLSGIGPAPALRALGIAVRNDLPGVGRNLQDRYEVAVTHRMARPWRVLQGARFERDDPLWTRWKAGRSGMYDGSGAAIAFVRRSQPAPAEPDIFCMALPALFEGYAEGFSEAIRAHDDRLTWAILKAHTRNRTGSVTLRSTDPRDPPQIDFHYFADGDADLQAVVDAIRFVRRMADPLLRSGVIAQETAPGREVDTDAALADYVRDRAWGHHASCTCAIGAAADGGVLGSDLRVHGTRRLRVADASVFPRIPGFFVAAAVYMVGEKAADLILHDAAPPRAAPPRPSVPQPVDRDTTAKESHHGV
jgi:choline dehydrogenase